MKAETTLLSSECSGWFLSSQFYSVECGSRADVGVMGPLG